MSTIHWYTTKFRKILNFVGEIMFHWYFQSFILWKNTVKNMFHDFIIMVIQIKKLQINKQQIRKRQPLWIFLQTIYLQFNFFSNFIMCTFFRFYVVTKISKSFVFALSTYFVYNGQNIMSSQIFLTTGSHHNVKY